MPEAVDSPALRMNLDLYHAQIGEGNLVELTRQSLPWVGEIQVADVPGRMEPGTGEVNYPAVASALARFGYRGTVGLEAFAHMGEEFRNPRRDYPLALLCGVLLAGAIYWANSVAVVKFGAFIAMRGRSS